jgi:beta-exotoxin I transport system permease protein
MSVATDPPAARRPSTPEPPSIWTSLRALLRRGLRDDRYVPLIWGGALGAFSVLIIFTWPSIEDSVGELVRTYPEGLKQAFGIEALDSVEAYFDAEMLSLIVPLAVAFLAVRTVSRAICGAEEQAWLDTLLTTPLSRSSLVAGALLVTAVLTALVLALMTGLALLAGVLSGTDPSAAVIGRGAANVWPLAMFFAGLAALAAGRLHSASVVTAIAAGTLVAMYLIDVVGKVSDSFEPLRWASAFKYYGSAVRDGIDPLAFVGLVLAGAALAALGAVMLGRRDLVA